MIFAKNLCYFKFYEAESFLLVSAPKIAHLSANVNPVQHKKSNISAHRIFILHPNIRQVFPESCTFFFDPDFFCEVFCWEYQFRVICIVNANYTETDRANYAEVLKISSEIVFQPIDSRSRIAGSNFSA